MAHQAQHHPVASDIEQGAASRLAVLDIRWSIGEGSGVSNPQALANNLDEFFKYRGHAEIWICRLTGAEEGIIRRDAKTYCCRKYFFRDPAFAKCLASDATAWLIFYGARDFCVVCREINEGSVTYERISGSVSASNG